MKKSEGKLEKNEREKRRQKAAFAELEKAKEKVADQQRVGWKAPSRVAQLDDVVVKVRHVRLVDLVGQLQQEQRVSKNSGILHPKANANVSGGHQHLQSQRVVVELQFRCLLRHFRRFRRFRLPRK